jgi:hypothetical protein
MKDNRATAILLHQIESFRQMSEDVEKVLRDERARLLIDGQTKLQPRLDADELNMVIGDMAGIRWRIRRLALMARGLEG